MSVAMAADWGMNGANVPRGGMRLAVLLSLLLHAGLVILVVILRAPAEPPMFPVVRLELIAAPAGVPQVGVVQPPKETPAPMPRAAEVPRKTTKPVPKTKAPQPQPKLAAANTPLTQPVASVPAPTAGSRDGGKGADVDAIQTPGVDFPGLSGYTKNVAQAILQRFGSRSGVLRATVSFTIRRDGSVNPDDIRIISGSSNYGFDSDAMAAIETAARQKAFGPLPKEFPADALFVTFVFEPKGGRS